MTRIIAGTKTEFSIDPAILALLPEQGSVELQRDAAGKVHHFHTHPVDEILVIIRGALKFEWDGGERICRPGDFLATIYHHLGIDAEKITINDFSGRPTPILPDDGKPIPELIA